MARLTGGYTIKVDDQRGKVLSRHANPKPVGARASQVGHGIILAITPDIVIDRLAWEQIKDIVEKAFRDDQEIPLKDPLW